MVMNVHECEFSMAFFFQSIYSLIQVYHCLSLFSFVFNWYHEDTNLKLDLYMYAIQI